MATTDDADDRETHDRWPTSEDAELLPSSFDRLVPTGQLVHGMHNPRRVSPSDPLRRSVANQGLEHPLIVHQPDDDGPYHITDGWQRYQAAVDAGWEQLPVRVHETAMAALQSTERESLGRDYSTYDWAQFCESVAAELEGDSLRALGRQVVEHVDNAPSVQTVTRYLRVLALPREIHTLLVDGPAGRKRDWQALDHYNPKIRRYDGLSWVVAHEIAKHRMGVSDQRLIGIAANAVKLDDRTRAKKFVRRAVEATDLPPETVADQVQLGPAADGSMVLPKTVMSMSPEEHQALIAYFQQRKTQPSEFIKQQVWGLVETAMNEGES